MEMLKMYIDGEWVMGVNGRIRTLINPVDGKSMEQVVEGDEEDVKKAVKAAKNSLAHGGSWHAVSIFERIQLLNKIADLLEEKIETMALAETKNTGRVIKETRNDDLPGAVNTFRSYAGILSEVTGNTSGGIDSLLSFTLHEPMGICGIVVPWNYPLLTASTFIAAALATGNSIVVKPSSLTPVTMVKLFEIMEEAGAPKGAINLILGSGASVGDALAENEDVNMIVFTGSTEVGKHLYEKCAKSVKKIMLELGGKSPVIVYEDADIESTVDNIMYSIFLSQGQVCLSGSRLYVHDAIYDELMEKLIYRTKKIALGNPLDINVEMGPVISKDHMEKVLEYIEKGKSEGGKIVCGGKRAINDEMKNGYYIEPTIFVDCKQNMSIVREEIFGPVLTVQKFSDDEEVINLANDTNYGLAAQIYTSNMSRAMKTANRIDAGIVWINTYLETNPGCSCTPYKQSGLGLVGGIAGLREYTKTKQVNMRLSASKNGWFAE